MSIKITGLALLGLIAAAPMSGSLAQEALAPGSNSFTEAQARGRIEDAGFADVSDLRKDDQGIWRAKAMRNGSPTEVGLDFKGNVVAGAVAPTGAGNNAVNVGQGRDGTAGNPPGTAAAWPLTTNVVLLGFANGVFSIAAIGSMMRLAGEGRARSEGVRMGVWGAAQALAFATGGLVGTGASDLAHRLLGAPAPAYASVFAFEALLFVLAAVLAARIVAPGPRPDRPRSAAPVPNPAVA